MNAYEQGFIDKCASAGVEPLSLIKWAQSHASQIIAGPNDRTQKEIPSNKVKKMLPKHYMNQSNCDRNFFANNWNHKTDEKNVVDRQITPVLV